MDSIWTPELIQQLGVLWGQGLSTAEIGRLVIGKMESKGRQNRRVRIRFG